MVAIVIVSKVASQNLHYTLSNICMTNAEKKLSEHLLELEKSPIHEFPVFRAIDYYASYQIIMHHTR